MKKFNIKNTIENVRKHHQTTYKDCDNKKPVFPEWILKQMRDEANSIPLNTDNIKITRLYD